MVDFMSDFDVEETFLSKLFYLVQKNKSINHEDAVNILLFGMRIHISIF